MKRALMVAYHFPPVAGVGVLRTLKFAKYLPRFGWEPIILTVRNPDPNLVRTDPGFIQDVPPSLKVYRAPAIPFGWIAKLGALGISYTWLFVPDPFVGWIPPAVSAGRRIIEREEIDLIYCTCPPVSALLIGMRLKMEMGLPLVIDYRDLWTENPYLRYPTGLHARFMRRLEERVLMVSDAVITVEEPSRMKLLRAFPFLSKTRSVHVIHNGFDPHDFVGVKPHPFQGFVILHAGTIYGPRLRHLEAFLKALREVIHERKLEDVRLVLVGRHPPSVERWLRRIARELGLQHVIHNLGYKPYRETLSLILGADILLLVPGASSVRTAKIYDYLASGKFILNISSPRSESANLIREAGAGVTVPPSPSKIRKALKEILGMRKTRVHIKAEVLAKYSRIQTTQQLSKVFNEVLSDYA